MVATIEKAALMLQRIGTQAIKNAESFGVLIRATRRLCDLPPRLTRRCSRRCGNRNGTVLRVGTDGPATDALAQIAAEAKFGTYERLLRFYRHLPNDWCEELPDTIPDSESLPTR